MTHDFHGAEDEPAGSELDPATHTAAAATPAGVAIRKRGRRRWLLLLVPVVAAVVALLLYLHGGRYQTTDDAYLQTGLAQVAPNVGGPVVSRAVHDNQQVHAGDELFRIDPAPYRTAVDAAQAQLADARAQVEALRASYRQGDATLATARERLVYAAREADRQQALLAKGIASRAQLDQALLDERLARAAIETGVQQNAGVGARLAGGPDVPAADQPAVRSAQAALDRARLNLSYTVMRALQDGTVTRVDDLQVGNFVTAGRPVFALAGRHVWVEANFKESQLHYMRAGQRATVRIDAFPDRSFPAHVRSFSPGTGNSFALLPPENATGNWVKVVQRLSVILELDAVPAGLPLHAGLSVEATVDTGHVRHLLGPDTTATP
jgi:membrane fusion protein (multidrug efflux system)